ncbi:MAG: V-type ATP synthase subunit I [Alistipes sp.]|nr:V-type ATP synthase subunit I [Alistipes sp.]
MMKYNVVLMASDADRFIESLRHLGMVDITTTGWEPSEDDRTLLLDIEARSKALAQLATLKDEPTTATVAAGTVFAAYSEAQRDIAHAKGEVARLQKLYEEWEPWGDFSVDTIAKLSSAGVTLRYFVTNEALFEEIKAALGSVQHIAEVSNVGGMVRFVVIGNGSDELSIDAQELKAPTMGLAELQQAIDERNATIARAEEVIVACAKQQAEIQHELSALKVRLQNVQINATASTAAEGLLLVVEGWAEAANATAVDALLNETPNLVYVKAKPTEEDNTPVKLKNNRFARLFELIGGMYALPKYGTLDMTPFFAPFYMLFFAICLNDAGYGAIIFALGLALFLKGGAKMRQVSSLTMICGGATTLFGLYTGSLFGMSIPDLLGYPSIEASPFFDFQGKFFSWALALGVFQIIFGMFLNIVFKARTFGITSTFSILGWFIVLLSSCLAGGLQMLDPSWVIPGFTLSSTAYYIALGVGALFMLLLNDIHRNPLLNFASGLWDTYNNITGLLSDVLSYIRLFAIGLSGGVLAQVFNSLAMGLTGLDSGIEQFTVGTIFQILGATAILLVGHGINLFMSSISSFVHPMRLTFVEFYKNAGFEMSTRAFEPLTDEE